MWNSNFRVACLCHLNFYKMSTLVLKKKVNTLDESSIIEQNKSGLNKFKIKIVLGHRVMFEVLLNRKQNHSVRFNCFLLGKIQKQSKINIRYKDV